MANKTSNKNKATTKKPLIVKNTTEQVITEKTSAFLAYKDMIPFNKWVVISVISVLLIVIL